MERLRKRKYLLKIILIWLVAVSLFMELALGLVYASQEE